MRLGLALWLVPVAANSSASATKDRVLIVLNNTARVPGSGPATGVRACEYTEPCEVFTAAGLEFHVASPLGGVAPIDPRSGSAEQVRRLPTAAVGAVCHGAAGLLSARRPDGSLWIAGRRVNGFTNAEESAAGMTSVVPFMLEDRLRAGGGRFESSGVSARHMAVDGALITGRNPASSTGVAEAMVRHLQGQQRQ